MKLSASFVNRLSAAVSQLYGSVGADVPTQVEASVSRILAATSEGFFLDIIDRILGENAAAAEDIVLAYFKNISNSAAVAELAAKAFVKAFSDAGSVTDAEVVAVSKVFQDSVVITDDVDGAASLLDDQEMQFEKVKTDLLGVTDVAATQADFYRAFTELPSVADVFTHTSAFSRAITETVSAADVFDRASSTLSRSFTEAVTVTDDVDGSASILDDQEMHFATQRTHIAEVADLFSSVTQFSRAFSDTSGATDGTLDLSVGKPRADSAISGDAIIVAPHKVLLETASLTDAGSLRSQGYADFTYFSEDYVGASRAF